MLNMPHFQEVYANEIERIAKEANAFRALDASPLNTARGTLVTLAASGSTHLFADTAVSDDGSDAGVPDPAIAAYYANIIDVMLFRAISREGGAT
jgi:hypothetical protein